jgi:hypothetical protein
MEAIVFVIAVVVIAGYMLNIYKLLTSSKHEADILVGARVAGILLAPLGAVLGYFK